MLLDPSGPLEVLSNADQTARQSYRLSVASITGGLVRSSCGIEIATEPFLIEPVEAARPMVEDGRQTFEEIARRVGFVDPDRMC